MTLSLLWDGLQVNQVATGCLAQHSYLVHNQETCMIVDPMRESAPYLDYLKHHGLALSHVLMTHVHADFVAGHQQLQQDYKALSGVTAPIVYGPDQNKISYDFLSLQDGHEIPLGDKKIKVLHTPGHTIESVCYLVDGKAILTGDTLFLGDVGRPDLAQGTDSLMTKEKMASLMYSSVQKLKQLDDSVVVLTGHGSGSPCGKNIQGGTHCTIGG